MIGGENYMSPIKYNLFKPKNRTRSRIFLGKKFYTLKRYILWMSGKYKFAVVDKNISYKYKCYIHSTPLLRSLKNVDMELQYNKIINLKLAVEKLDKVVIRPGETFSYWKLIGKPTARKGYVDGMVLFNGNYGKGIGGGLCQLSNLIYWMTLHTPLTIIERYRHSFDVFPDSCRTQPFGSGATCVYNYRDLMIRNDTDQNFQLNLLVSENELEGVWKSNKALNVTYKVYERNHRIIGELFGGYSRHNELCRTIFNKEGQKIDDEFITENHAIMMYNPLLEDMNHT